MLDGAPCNIVENEFVKPGKGQAFNRVRIRNLKTSGVSGANGPSVAALEKLVGCNGEGEFASPQLKSSSAIPANSSGLRARTDLASGMS